MAKKVQSERQSLLEIDSGGNPETVVIDGERYTLTDFDDLSAVDQHRLKSNGNRITALMDQETLSEKEQEELNEITHSMFQRVAGSIPEDVQKKLKPGARQRLVIAFFTKYSEAMSGGVSAEASLGGPEKSSPASNGSTAESPAGG